MNIINNNELEMISGGSPLTDLFLIVETATKLGNKILNSLPVKTQNAIGGTIDQALYDLGITDTLHDVPVG